MANQEKFGQRGPEKTIQNQGDDFGQKVEWDIALSFFKQELKSIFPETVHTSEEVDRAKGVDFVLRMADGSYIAVQFSTAENRDVWVKKSKDIMGRGTGLRVKRGPMVFLKDIYPNPQKLTRRELVMQIPVVLVGMEQQAIEEAYYQYKTYKQQSAQVKNKVVDFLPYKDKLKVKVLRDMVGGLEYFSSDEIAAMDKDAMALRQRYPELAQIAKPMYNFLSQNLSQLRRQGRIL